MQDRLIQRLLLEYLNDGDKLRIATPVSYGFRRGRGIQTAIKKARNLRRSHPWILKSDISSFFDTIRRDDLKAKILARLRGSSIGQLVIAAIDTEIQCADEDERIRIRKAGLETGRGLRQGMPLSPTLSNLVLRELDLHLNKRGIHIVRYADDFVVLADNEDQCRNALALAKELLAKIGHAVPDLAVGAHSKTVIYCPDDPVEFLGFELRRSRNGYEIAVPREAFEEVARRLQPFQEFSTARRRWQHLSRTVSTLNSTIDGFINVYRLGKNFGDFRSHAYQLRRQALEDLLVGIFGVDVLKNLDPARLDFLDIVGTADSRD